MYDFDAVIDRHNTNSVKYDFPEKYNMPEGLLPFWDSDMDFRVAPAITEALQKRVNHGIYGYSDTDDSYWNAVRSWYKNYFNWDVKREWLVKTPGIIPAFHIAIRALTKPDDAVLIQPPAYFTFTEAITRNGRRVVNCPLTRKGSKYIMNDFDDIERTLAEKNVKLAILCSPHNPVGRVWTREELSEFSRVCRIHGVRIIVNEIHQDFVYPGVDYTPFAHLSEEAVQNAVICTTPAKSFNLCGLPLANIWIKNPTLRAAFVRELACTGFERPNIMSLLAAEAAYNGGRGWLEEVKHYVKGNIDFTREFLKNSIPRMQLVEPESTYLLWLDCRGYSLTDEELARVVIKDAGLWLDQGILFGAEGSGFLRMNIACPRATLKEGLTRLAAAFQKVEEELQKKRAQKLDGLKKQ